MRTLLPLFDTSSRALSYFLGAVALVLATAVWATSMGPEAIANWTLEVFGISFVSMFALLVFISLYSWVRLTRDTQSPEERTFWLECGLHGANGVSTLALTYTLLGISLGIGSLADQQLTPETVQEVIRGLTHHFSLAFLTTVLGLPSAAVLRALLGLSEQRLRVKESS